MRNGKSGGDWTHTYTHPLPHRQSGQKQWRGCIIDADLKQVLARHSHAHAMHLFWQTKLFTALTRDDAHTRPIVFSELMFITVLNEVPPTTNSSSSSPRSSASLLA